MGKIKGWNKIKDKNSEQVWVSKDNKIRVIVAKGDKTYSSWYEKNTGPIGQNAAHIPNSWITTLEHKRSEVTKKAVAWMRKNKRRS